MRAAVALLFVSGLCRAAFADPSYCTLRPDQLNYCLGGSNACDANLNPVDAAYCQYYLRGDFGFTLAGDALCHVGKALPTWGISFAPTFGQFYHNAWWFISPPGSPAGDNGRRFDSEYDAYCFYSGACVGHADATSDCYSALSTTTVQCVTARDCGVETAVDVKSGAWALPAAAQVGNSQMLSAGVGLLLGCAFILGLKS